MADELKQGGGGGAAKKDADPVVHELKSDHVKNGGVTLAEFRAADDKHVEGFPNPINELAFAAAGTNNGDRDIGEGERAVNASRIDEAVRAHASWLETQPVETRLLRRDDPVIMTPESK